jgi:hypothetical protein
VCAVAPQGDLFNVLQLDAPEQSTAFRLMLADEIICFVKSTLPLAEANRVETNDDSALSV